MPPASTQRPGCARGEAPGTPESPRCALQWRRQGCPTCASSWLRIPAQSGASRAGSVRCQPSGLSPVPAERAQFVAPTGRAAPLEPLLRRLLLGEWAKCSHGRRAVWGLARGQKAGHRTNRV
ncbi:hypothetical protein NDU88_010571 [Pleurodeles waltl]|uniref:Uncharacterized protein n=1 Tax=Pleurodeles waltl TaxID=8319 RepID=A0AAV7Q2L0_PLEWA|nr:hypothetical protein NDU88_010571 [Pleurodeles waltl]